jgi:predicted GNAT family N-acyltransferase
VDILPQPPRAPARGAAPHEPHAPQHGLGEPLHLRGAAGALTLEPCGGAAARGALFAFRQAAWRGRADYLLGNRAGRHPAEDEYDDGAHHFVCSLDGALVAACRWCPSGAQGFEAERLAVLPPGSLEPRDHSLQISRLVVREDLRRMQLSELLLWFACRALLAQGSYREWFALAVPRLAEHYVHFGGSAWPDFEVTLASRQGQRYRLVRGGIERSEQVLAAALRARAPGGPWELPSVLTLEPQVSP